jgi:hypothetical protein
MRTNNLLKAKSAKILGVSLAGLLFTAALAQASVLAIDFGAAYVSTNINSNNTITHSNGDFNFNGESNDRVSSIAFGSVFTPPNSGNWTTVPGKSNGTIYQGVSIAVFNNQSIDPGIPINRINSNNRIQLGNANAGTETYSLAVALYWEAADFLSSGTGGLVDAAGSMSVTVNSTGIRPNVRFMVQAGGEWYLSQSSSSNNGSFSINGGAANWYAFDPSANALFWDETAPGATISGNSLGTITAAGIYAQTDAGYTGSASMLGVDGLQISLIPEPRAYALVAGFLSFVGVVLLRCKR